MLSTERKNLTLVKHPTFVSIVCLCANTLISCNQFQQSDQHTGNIQDTIYVESALLSASDIFRLASPSIVIISTNNGFGSGFFIDSHTIITNYHVIHGATEVRCHHNGREITIDGYFNLDAQNDLVLLSTAYNSTSTLSLSQSETEIGTEVITIGHPRGHESTLSNGIVSGFRDYDGRKLIQITAPISPGSSGGPVLNYRGEVIGVSVLSDSEGQNLNFAIPGDIIRLNYSFKSSYAKALDEILRPRLTYNEINLENANWGTTNAYLIRNWDESLNPNLSVDFIMNHENKTIFFFTYRSDFGFMPESTIWLDAMNIVDPQTQLIITAVESNLGSRESPRVVEDGISSRFYVIFPRIPEYLSTFNLVEGECESGAFCFRNVRIGNALTTLTEDQVSSYSE